MKPIALPLVAMLNLALLAPPASANPGVQCWGSNAEGQSSVPSDLTLAPSEPAHPVEVRTGRGVTCALDKSGSISCWGMPAPDLARLEALKGVTTFGLSSVGACAIAGGQLQCFSAVGDSTFESIPTLVQPKSVQVGEVAACAQDANGVQCWGGQDNLIATVPTFNGLKKFILGATDACGLDQNGIQCWGDGNFFIESVPTLSNPSDLFMGNSYACAFDDKGLECWGTGATFLPTPQPSASVTPSPSPVPSGQYVSGQAHVCVLTQTGTVLCKGDDTFGQLSIPPLSHPKKIFADPVGNQTCALDDSGLVCWGEDQANQSSLSAVNSLSAGVGNTCVTQANGTMRCWGYGSTTVNAPPSLGDAYQMALGSNFACAVNFNATANQSCWGDNATLVADSPPLPILGPVVASTVFQFGPGAVSAGFAHACYYSGFNIGSAVPTIVCFGNNDFGQSKVPTGFNFMGNPSTFSAGGYHSCAIDPVLGLHCWGKNEFGESTIPSTLKNPRQVAAGLSHTCALDDNGVTCWGRSTEGQTTVPKLSHPRQIQAGGYHSCAVDDNGVTCWGADSFGQIDVPSTLGKSVSRISTGLFHSCAVTQ